MLVKLLTVGLVGFVAMTAVACSARSEKATPAPQPPPAATLTAPSPAVPVVTPTAPSSAASTATPQQPPAAPLTDEQVLAQVDEMLRTGVLPPLNLSQSLLSDSATPVLWADVPAGDLGSFNANLDFTFSVPPVNIQAPNVSSGR